ncbi:hypothetical protein TRICHSKD4_2642 [Roseibium sp. TrichSKD4]|nr:hypothetical protein TRICHSKD4_2642 [Roseibium sp. TrichSKD4]
MVLMKLAPKFYVSALTFVGLLCLAPIAFNTIVDAYNHNRWFDLGLDKAETSVKAHYPLYKMIEYPRIKSPTVVLGDSRARALQDKYWKELGRDDVYNFAYGGATVYEIYDTFQYLKQSTDLETLIVSLPLRSMDARFKGGMNRVPEAISLAENPFKYYTNWFVAKIGWTLLEERYPSLKESFQSLSFHPVQNAFAGEFFPSGELSLDKLLDPELCDECQLATPLNGILPKIVFYGHGFGLGAWARFWPEVSLDRELPSLFAKQVGTNGAADWRRFKQSDELWSMVEEMAAWCAENDVRLVFLIPPTITEMQQRIGDFGLSAANHKFRERLAAMAPVIDLDFSNAFTEDLANFTDAYHFGSKPARKIVGELLLALEPTTEQRSLATKRRGTLSCPTSEKDTRQLHQEDGLELREGSHCRIWRQKDV